MTITSCVKNKRTNILPQNPSQVALLFKDGGGLANHPLSCHPQGVLGSRESGRKGEKMKQKKKSGKTPTQQLCIQQSKNQDPPTRFHLSLYSAQISKNTKIPSIPIIHEVERRTISEYMKGKMVKCKKWVNRKSKGPKITNAGRNFCRVRKFRTLRKFWQAAKSTLLHFLASSALLSF